MNSRIRYEKGYFSKEASYTSRLDTISWSALPLHYPKLATENRSPLRVADRPGLQPRSLLAEYFALNLTNIYCHKSYRISMSRPSPLAIRSRCRAVSILNAPACYVLRNAPWTHFSRCPHCAAGVRSESKDRLITIAKMTEPIFVPHTSSDCQVIILVCSV